MRDGDDGLALERPDWDGWRGPSADPNDRQFGDAIDSIAPAEAGSADAVLVGEPYDGAVIGRRGAREAPLEIRRSLAAAKTAHLERRDPTATSSAVTAPGEGSSASAKNSSADEGPRIGDLGDLELPDAGEASVAAVQERVRAAARRIHDLDSLPVFLGGDNSLTYANVAPLLEAGRVGVINIDAHLDCREVREGPTSGTPYRQLLEAGLETYACVGARHFETSGAYVEYVRERGGTIVPAEAFAEGVSAVAATVREALESVDVVYLSVDCDVLDATAAPGVSAPTPGGLTTRELFAAVGTLAADDRLAGLEVVECAPPLDEGGQTVDAAARTVAHALASHLEGCR